jgi:hypothetical protein
MTDSQRARQGYSDANLLAASVIAGRPELYPEGSLPALWSDLILSRAANPDDREAGPLFAAQSRRCDARRGGMPAPGAGRASLPGLRRVTLNPVVMAADRRGE